MPRGQNMKPSLTTERKPSDKALVNEKSARFGVQGQIKPGFEAMGDAFADNFVQRRELGGACCIYLRGENVVDL